MSPVLRTFMAKAAPSCGGRSVFSRRNFSSLPGIEEWIGEAKRGGFLRALRGVSIGYVIGYFGLQEAVDETKAIIQERRDKRKSVGKFPDVGTDNLSSEKNTSETALLKSVGQNNETHSVTS
ncbi:hypothetical protein ISN45_Aa03g008610 [Arabidopsis thaliana x Arabidopsis arenosa]|uniref:Uncharacterized protein n=1 Tax=Arabidopsis thaliana x Arabidopsis arenosa TaxID=1240361 RepID=A0A8T2AR17_9BRAS|nr:hypothetical protein ISN45_Aa03g008610 [Arabidopsis thaliana x Arabidopsis arenosa]